MANSIIEKLGKNLPNTVIKLKIIQIFYVRYSLRWLPLFMANDCFSKKSFYTIVFSRASWVFLLLDPHSSIKISISKRLVQILQWCLEHIAWVWNCKKNLRIRHNQMSMNFPIIFSESANWADSVSMLLCMSVICVCVVFLYHLFNLINVLLLPFTKVERPIEWLQKVLLGKN